MSMMLSKRNQGKHTQCVFGCCTDFPRTGRANRTRKRMVRAREIVAWSREAWRETV